MPLTKDVITFGTFVVTSQVRLPPILLLGPSPQPRTVAWWLLTLEGIGLPPKPTVLCYRQPEAAASRPRPRLPTAHRPAFQ